MNGQTPQARLRAVVRIAERRLRALVMQWNDRPPTAAKHRIQAVADALLRVLRNGNPKSPKK